jgi:hypothetical protein
VLKKPIIRVENRHPIVHPAPFAVRDDMDSESAFTFNPTLSSTRIDPYLLQNLHRFDQLPHSGEDDRNQSQTPQNPTSKKIDLSRRSFRFFKQVMFRDRFIHG